MLLLTVSVTSQNLSITGSCGIKTGKLIFEGYAETTTYNNKPVYYNENLAINYQANDITEDVYLYYALANEIGTPENRWVVSYGGQPYYYNISDNDTAPLGIYSPFNINATKYNCGEAITIGIYNASLSNPEFENENFNCSPNPTSSILNISNSKNITNVTVVNIIGQIMISKKTNATHIQVDLSNLANATYFVRLVADNTEKVIKVIKD